jgi:hypothetical protein
LSGQTDQEFVELNPDFALRWVKSYRNLQGEAWGRAIKQVALESLAVRLTERIRLLEATLKLIAYPELQDNYTPQQLARHALRIEPLSPHQEGADPERKEEDKP